MTEHPDDPFFLMMLRTELGFRAQRGAAAGRSALRLATEQTGPARDPAFYDAIDSMLFHAGIVEAFMDPKANLRKDSDREGQKRLRKELKQIAAPRTDRGLWTQVREIRNDAAHIDENMIEAYLSKQPMSLRAGSAHHPGDHYSWDPVSKVLGMQGRPVRVPDLVDELERIAGNVALELTFLVPPPPDSPMGNTQG